MDPNACLERFFSAVGDNDLREACEAKRDLASWLANGGFAPDWSAAQKGDFEAFTLLPRYTSVGSYPLLYLGNSGRYLCHCCATAEELSACDADVHWEGEPYDCDECGEPVESAYGSEAAG